MGEAPELTSITRRKTVRPLVAAWMFVIVLMATGAIWLSLSDDVETAPEAAPTHEANAPSGENISIALADDTGHGTVPISATENSVPVGEEQPVHKGLSLVKAPIDGLTHKGANGFLPVLGPDSRVAWKEYARPVDAAGQASDDRPKLAIIVTGIGLNSRSSNLALAQLPGEIDFGFSPYGRNLQVWMDKARANGHEGFLMIPTEPVSYPENDPGPHTLLAGAPERDNLKKLDWLLSQVTGYVGVINEMGSKFTTSEKDVMPILNNLNGRGLMVLDAKSTRFSVVGAAARRISMPRAINNLYIDNQLSAAEISRNLTVLENTARTYGVALGVARAFPLTIREIEKWARELEARGVDLVPVTAIANRQPIR
ncbi:MAG: divergent polysaccharide deacetylase family protein [Alphaproteobacteria bacterium]|nr:divergent polysaccharide deacetylase family protein [Alphaproteobacteria bacterium]